MWKLMSARLVAGLATFAAISGARAEDPPASLDTWVDYCTVMPEAKFGVLGDAECALIYSNVVVQRDRSTYDILVEPRTRYRQEGVPPEITPPPFCMDSKFFGEDRAIGAYPGRSGVLVGSDLVLTAAHGISANDTTVPWTVVFGFSGRPIVPGLPICWFQHTVGISADNVYRVVQIVAYGPRDANGIDLMLLRLDRPVVNRMPIRVRREGHAEPDDRLVAVGHPDQLTTKVDLWGRFASVSGNPPTMSTSGIHSFNGSSGSMLYNWERDYVEGLISYPGAVTDVLTAQGCYKSVHVNGVQGIGPIITPQFASFIPPVSLVVSPIDTPTHIGPVGGPVSNSPMTHFISTRPGATGPALFDVRVEPQWSPGSGLPRVQTSITRYRVPDPAEGEAPNPGPTAGVSVSVDVAGVPRGVYASTVRVTDLETGFVDTLIHKIEVGASDFSVTPTDGINELRMAPPIQVEKRYALKNITPTPVTIEVRTGADWVTLNGVEAHPGGTLTQRFALGPAGSKADSSNFLVGISRRFESGPLGVFPSTLTIDNLDNSALGRGDTYLPVQFQWRIRTYYSDRPLDVIVPDGSPEGLVIDLPVTDQFCLSRMFVTVGPFGAADTSELRITLTSPEGRSVILSDQEKFPAEDEGYTFSTPSMEELLGRPAFGNWTLRIADVVPGGSQFAFKRWSLLAESAGAVPCQ